MAQSAEQLSEEEDMQQKIGSRPEINDAGVQNGHVLDQSTSLTLDLLQTSQDASVNNTHQDNQTSGVNNNAPARAARNANENEADKECSVFSKEDNGELARSSKMTSSATQTVDLFAVESGGGADGHLHLPQDDDDDDVSNLASMYHGTWPMDKVLWQSGPGSLGGNGSLGNFYTQDTASVMSFRSNVGSTSSQRRSLSQQLGTKVEMVYSLLSMLGSHDKDDMSKTLFSMSKSQESCVAMRQSGCLPLLVDLIHTTAKDVANLDSNRPSRETRVMASQTLHNIVHSHPDDKRGRREARVLRLLEQIREYCDAIHDSDSGSDDEQQPKSSAICEQHPVPTMAMLMKLSFDEEHRHAMCQLGGLQAIAELIQADYSMHGNANDHDCITLRRYAGMALTNLTFGDGTNKALLCSMRPFMKALVAQLHSPSEDLRQVVASVLRNLSWRADQASKRTLQEVGAVITLTKAAIEATKESTLKSILSALWNLSAHCSTNKAGICAVDGALAFLVDTLTYKSPSKTLAIVENGGGILRNISSHVAVREDYREILRQHHCLQILLQHLRSPSLTIVSNACGTLWNLSARCPEDQHALWEMNAVNMLRNLVNSKHKMISMGSSAALKNLLAARPDGAAAAVAAAADSSGMPCLLVRKQRALEAELDPNLAETCENLDSPKSSPTHIAQRVDPERRYQASADTGLHGRGSSSSLMAALHTRMHNSMSGGNQTSSNAHLTDSMSGSSVSDISHDRRQPGSWQEALIQSTVAAAAKKSEIPVPMVRMKNTSTVTAVKVVQAMKEEKEVVAVKPVESTKKEQGLIAPKRRPKSSGGGLEECSGKSGEGLRGKNSTSGIPRPFSAHAAPERFTYDKYSDLTSIISNLNLDDQERPVDYSLKYSESEGSTNGTSRLNCASRLARPAATVTPESRVTVAPKPVPRSNNNFLLETEAKVEDAPAMTAVPYLKKLKCGTMSKMEDGDYGQYAETDLDGPDQPTNYSLLYPEDMDTTDHFMPPAPKYEVPPFYAFGVDEPSVHDDTLMTYCTEGTPLNFSTATSMTDLREGLREGKVDVPTKDVKRSEAVTAKGICQVPKVDAASSNKTVVDDVPANKQTSQFCIKGKTPSASLEETRKEMNLGEGVAIKQEEFGSVGESAATKNVDGVVENVGQREDATLTVKQGARKNSQHNGEQKGHDKEVKSVTFGEENYTEETPLMFSRCSSLGSLSSFDQHSIHDDHSSVVSDFSRRASEVVSPSDLPDSPSETMPPSPRPRKTSATFDFTTKTSDSTHTIRQPRSERQKTRPLEQRPLPQAPCQPAVGVPRLRVPPVQNNLEQHSSTAPKDSGSIFEEVPQLYLEEGTPLRFSAATSLSSLAIDEHTDEIACDDVAKDHEVDECPVNADRGDDRGDDRSPEAPDCHVESTHDQSRCGASGTVSDDEDNEDDLLAECINSGMPNNTKHHRRKYNNSKLMSRVNVLNTSIPRAPVRAASTIPIKVNNLMFQRPNSSNCVPSAPCGNSASCDPATVPCQKNTNNVNIPKKVNNLSHCPPENSSDSGSAFDDENEHILDECIISAMPRSKASNSQLSRLSTNIPDGRESTKEDKRSRPNIVKPVTPARKATDAAWGWDCVKTYAYEGTPVNFSTSSSLSGGGGGGGFKDRNDCKSEDLKNCWQPEMHPRMTPADGCSAEDSLKNFQMEGTPASFSRNESLSSLSVCDMSEYGGLEHDSVQQQIPSKLEGKRQNVEGGFFLNENGCRSSYPETEDIPRRFATEDTPAIFSPNSSVSSVSSTGCVDADMTQKPPGPQQLQQQPRAVDDRAGGSFSRNSSLSSLSVESLGDEPSLLDKALLEQCINEAMPKKSALTPSSSEAAAEDLRSPTTRPKNGPGSAAPCAADATTEEIKEQGDVEDEGKDNDDVVVLSVKGAKIQLGDALSMSMIGGFGARRPSADVEMKMSGSLDQMHIAKKALSLSLPRGSLTHAGVSKGNIPELVLRALGNSNCKPPTTSMENVSMRSSLTASEVLDNVKPPSLMDDMDLNSSTYSICSIASEVEEPRSEIPSMKESVNSDLMLACVRPAAIMAELFCREVAATATSLKSSVSECIDNINPPSIFQDLTEATGTLDNSTKVPCSESPSPDGDTDIEDDLPEDAEPVHSDQGTLKHRSSARKNRSLEEKPTPDDSIGVEEVVVTMSEDTECSHSASASGEADLSISPDVVQALQHNANLVLSTLNESRGHFLMGDDAEMIECETVSLVSNDDSEDDSSIDDEVQEDEEEEEEESREQSPVPKGPRIVKPIIRDAIRRLSLKKDNEEGQPRGIRGRRKALYTRSSSTPSSMSPAGRSLSPKVRDVVVKPTRTSALRANQSLQKTVVSPVMSTTSSQGSSSPPPAPKKEAAVKKTVRGRGFVASRNTDICGSGDLLDKGFQRDQSRPKPPNKQGTFTKEAPTQDLIPKISPSKTRIPLFAAPQKTKPGNNSPQQQRWRKHNSVDGTGTNGGVTGGYQRSISMNPEPQSKMITPTKRLGSGFLNNRSRASALKSAKRSSSNASLCSSASDSTTTSRKSSSTTTSAAGNRDVASKVATLWKKDGSGRSRSAVGAGSGGSSGGEGSSGSENNNRIRNVPAGGNKEKRQGSKLVPRSATYEKLRSPPEDCRKKQVETTLREVWLETSKIVLNGHGGGEVSVGQDGGSKCHQVMTVVSEGKCGAAIVQPFNYNPNAAAAKASTPRSMIPTPTKMVVPSLRHHPHALVKQTSFIEGQVAEKSEESSSCLITTV